MTSVHGYATAAAGFEIIAISTLNNISAVVAFYCVSLYFPHIFLIHYALCCSMG